MKFKTELAAWKYLLRRWSKAKKFKVGYKNHYGIALPDYLINGRTEQVLYLCSILHRAYRLDWVSLELHFTMKSRLSTLLIIIADRRGAQWDEGDPITDTTTKRGWLLRRRILAKMVADCQLEAKVSF